jgi:cell division control protein 24
MIKFQNEDMMKKWAAGLDLQRKENAPRAQQSPDQTAPNFTWMATQGAGMENPYAQQDDDDDDDSYSGTTATLSQYGPGSAPTPMALPGTMPRNASSTSLRQRSATAESSQSLAGLTRAPPPRFPLPQPGAPLSVQTQGASPPHPSPGPRGGDSYFSPVAESPASSRTSTTSGMFPSGAGFGYPMGMMSQSGWSEDNNRYTAPAMPRAPSRDGSMAANGRNPRGPSMPVMPRDATAQMQRSRSYSTPDINGQPNGPRRPSVQQGQGAVPAVPGIPAHLTHERHDSNLPRSSSGNPANDLPIRANTQSPGVQRARELQQRQYVGGTMAQFPSQPLYPRQGTPLNGALPPQSGPPPQGLAPLAPVDLSRTISPSLGTAPLPGQYPPQTPELPLPTQLKVKVNCDSGNYITLVVNYNITYQILIDRIDNKLSRFTTSSIGRGSLRLRYRDEDGDFVTVESDDDIQIAISEWREGMRNQYTTPGGVGEIELFCVGEI